MQGSVRKKTVRISIDFCELIKKLLPIRFRFDSDSEIRRVDEACQTSLKATQRTQYLLTKKNSSRLFLYKTKEYNEI